MFVDNISVIEYDLKSKKRIFGFLILEGSENLSPPPRVVTVIPYPVPPPRGGDRFLLGFLEDARKKIFFSKNRHFLTSNRILMFENTFPTLLDVRDVFRIRF